MGWCLWNAVSKDATQKAPCEAVTQSDSQIRVRRNGMQGPPKWCKAIIDGMKEKW